MGPQLIFLLLARFLSLASSTDISVKGCGGFAEASTSLARARKPSDGKLDYSHVMVELQTLDGLVKDRTQCAPNGYYFIPVYDKGTFIVRIKGPTGWSWNPDNVSVIVDDHGCNSNADINFQLTGFAVSGAVRGAVGGASCSMKNEGPSGVKVELLSLTNDIIRSAYTSPEGGYFFSNVPPGKYKLYASHPSMKVENRYSPEVDFGFGNNGVDDIFFVPGYDISGFVVSQGNPILGVHIYLCSDDVLELNCSRDASFISFSKNVLCHTTSDAEGTFIFHMVPCGTYELLAYYKGENRLFDVSPAVLNVSVEHRHVKLEQKFQVTGFSVGGRVTDGTGSGIEGVHVKVNGFQRSITDSQGHYMLDQVTSRSYTITAEKEHYRFNSLEQFMVLPNIPSLPDISVAYYDICGVVSSTYAYNRAKVALTHGPANVKPQVKLTNESGNFCFEVPHGEYRLSALSSKEQSGLLFLPAFIDVMVDRPILDLKFFQALVDIRGQVICKEESCSSVSVFLKALTGGLDDERRITLAEDSSSFIFSKVYPGSYLMKVKCNTLREEDKCCWKQDVLNLYVGTEGMEGISFVQKGYWITIVSSHDVNASVHHIDAEPFSLAIKKGSQKICIESSGLHELHFHGSCISFGRSPVMFDPSVSQPLYLKGDKYLIMGEIHIDRSLCSGDCNLYKNVTVDIFNKENGLSSANYPVIVYDLKSQPKNVIYKYSTWANLGDELFLVPRDVRNNEERKILFYPREQQISVGSDDCQAAVPPFIGRMGLYIEGSVSPPVVDVNFKVTAVGRSSTGNLDSGDVAVETKTGDDGKFSVGPLYDDTNYSVTASKPGYHLKQVGPGLYSCQKLSEISVHVYFSEILENVFPSVLLSLSGEDGYRNNSISDAGRRFLFDNLFPGNFYLRPLLKEYSFFPPAQAIDLVSGETKEVRFHAKRVAYSVLGAVLFLTGQPMEGVVVEARSESEGYYEQTRTDPSGNYRLRGLLPHVLYCIKVLKKIEGGEIIERVSPEFIMTEVTSKDVKAVNFVAFEYPEITILSGRVEGTNLEKLQPYLLIEVRSARNPSKVESISPVPLSYYFHVRGLPKEKLIIQIKPSSSSILQKFVSEITEVDLTRRTQMDIGALRFIVEEPHHKLEAAPAPVFPLIVGMLVIVLFIFIPRMSSMYRASTYMDLS